MPKVSVIVPNYNHARYLPRRLDSILDQTFTDFELIILDDASTDNSLEVIQPYLANSRVSFHPNKVNSGSSCIQWNRGVQLARGEYVWIAESDDFCAKEFLETMIPLLENQPHAGLAYCQSWRVDMADNLQGTLEDWTADLDQHRWKTDYANNGVAECKNYLLWKNTVPNASAVLIRKAAYLKAGGAPEDMRLCGDWLTWVRILMISDVIFSAQCLNNFRKHDASVRETTSTRKHSKEMWRVRHHISRHCSLSKQIRRALVKEAFKELYFRFRTALLQPFRLFWHKIRQGVATKLAL